MHDQTILIPIEYPDPEYLPETLIEAVSGLDVVLLAWCAEDGDAARREYEKAMRADLYEYAAKLLRAGSEVDVELFFGDDGSIQDRIADEQGVDAVYVPRPIDSFGRLLVPLRDERTADDIAAFVGALDEDALVHVTLLHVAAEDADVPAAEEMLARIERRVEADGMPWPSVDAKVVVDDDPAFCIANEASDYDAVAIGETEPTLEEKVFGKTYDRIAEAADEPVIVVRRD